jgi:hypothetical protein
VRIIFARSKGHTKDTFGHNGSQGSFTVAFIFIHCVLYIYTIQLYLEHKYNLVLKLMLLFSISVPVSVLNQSDEPLVAKYRIVYGVRDYSVEITGVAVGGRRDFNVGLGMGVPSQPSMAFAMADSILSSSTDVTKQ